LKNSIRLFFFIPGHDKTVANALPRVPITSASPLLRTDSIGIAFVEGEIFEQRRLKYSDPNDTITANDLIDSVFATAIHDTRASANRSLMNNTPGSLAFHRDMLLDIPLVADLITIRNSRQTIIDESLRVANLHRLNHDYRAGERVLFKVYNPSKLEDRWTGPYEIITVHVNGTLTIRLNAHTVERVNIRRLKPYRS
jgi:hypothetical protein